MIQSFGSRETARIFQRESSDLLPKKLKGKNKTQYSIRINDQWRICFEWRDNHAYKVEIMDYH